jgi:NAD(P)-dependent dehydrogenase (short-subunit alcohol dehydrogenase family)
MRVVITGANRGIGLELARQLLERGDDVEAAVRRPEAAGELRRITTGRARLRIHACDVGDGDSVAELARSIGDLPVDALINNAGVWGGEHQRVGDLDFEEALRTYQVNALGPLRVTLALLPHLRRGEGRRVLHVTSGLGSIEDNTSGGTYGYRMAKAALNMMARNLAIDLRGERIASAVINPGWVKTDMGGPRATTTVHDSARGILAQLDTLDLDRSGQFLDWKGGTYPW